jgi:hypothetical protein
VVINGEESGVLPVVVVLQPPKLKPVFDIGNANAGFVRLPIFSGSEIRTFVFCITPTASGAYPEVAPLLLKYVDQTNAGI